MTSIFRPNHLLIALVALGAIGTFAGCGSNRNSSDSTATNLPIRHQDATATCCAGNVYVTRGTGYYPASNRLEGGHYDRRGKKLKTLQDFIDGRTSSVSVAMDPKLLPYGAAVCIPELNAKYGKSIPFRVVDTGGAFKGKGTSRIDICTRTRSDAHSKAINRRFELVVCDR